MARIDGLDRFEEMFEVVVVTLQSVRDDVDGPWNDDSLKLAGSLFNACTEFTFIISLVIANCGDFVSAVALDVETTGDKARYHGSL